MCEHQRAPRGGGQPEGSDDDLRGEADPRPSYQKNSEFGVFCFSAQFFFDPAIYAIVASIYAFFPETGGK